MAFFIGVTLNFIRPVFRLFFLSCAIFSLLSCAGTYHIYVDTLKQTFKADEDVQLSLDDVKSSKIDLALVKAGDRPTASMALAYIESGQHKWVSADNAMLIKEQGRIVRTLGLAQNLLFTTNKPLDPLKNAFDSLKQAQWTRTLDWEHGEFGYQVTSNFDYQGETSVSILGKQFKVGLVNENARYPNPSNFWHLSENWTNQFWFDLESGTLLKSLQKLSPNGEEFVTTYVSRAARLLP